MDCYIIYIIVNARQEAHNPPETGGRGANYETYFPSEQALTRLLPLTSSYPMNKPLTWPFLIAREELW
jgi:hypothetical protein